ncbi:hypothetical protein P4282_10340 [Bacillus swezeyi]|uniref:hypothetical protein n=1 Tax=Bacillus swezeyi TaxID=1925020 RepID=UPI002E1A8F1B|nr:hypothetical protein [Bacillus swezeyi]
MKFEVRAEIIMDVDAWLGDEKSRRRDDYTAFENFVVEADSYELANKEVSKQLKGWDWLHIESFEPIRKNHYRVHSLWNSDLYRQYL